MIELDKYKLGDIADVFTGFPFKGDKYSDRLGIKVLRGENVSLGYLRWDTVKYWNENFNEFEKYSLKENDIVVGMDGSRVGRNRAQIKQTDLPLLLAQRVARIRAKKNYSQSLLSYIIKGEKFENYVNAVKTGTSIPHISARQINSFEFVSPVNINVQDNIASILSSLDDKIELNLQMNQTLENMAQAIFREWFVNFNFPGFDGELVDGLPKGWRMGKLGEDYNLTMGQSPPGETYNKSGDGIVFYQGRTDFEFRFPRNRMFTTAPSRIAEKFDTLVSVRAPVGDINMANEKCCIGRGLSAIRHKSGAHSFTYYSMWNIKPSFSGFESEGTVFGSINKSNFEGLSIIIPHQSIIQQFETMINPIDEKIFNNSLEIEVLTQLRDKLLPKLMTGKIEIKN